MSDPLVSCLTATYGRYRVLCEAVTCFLQQDYDNKELIILNNHRVPLECDLPQVVVYNEPVYPTLGDCRNRLLELATGDFIRTWDDDDLYLPWAISQGVEYINDAPAWKSLYNYGWRMDKDEFYLSGNKYEAAWTVRADVVRKFGYLPLSGGNEHNSLEEGIKSLGGIKRTDVRPSYIYRYGAGLIRISGSLDKTDLGWKRTSQRTERWMRHNDDHGSGESIHSVSLSEYWRRVEQYELDKNADQTG